ncbi:YceI family protein [Christiangramia fulva]|uniref:YceI family protein n=1 Tax=Christiangramia fulva TaxID=2126553 RepID=A0A2R3ZAY5_9FLAO|nr:YceI family protein [Christiangramia fulva]AVR47384.1 YceI family protein [Christiangramia fulva]
MKANGNLKFLLIVLLLGFGTNLSLKAQSYTLNQKPSYVLVDGTSNIHDWSLEAESFSGNLKAEFDEGKLEELEQLNFTVMAESLKSGKSGMDKNTYNALKTNSYKKISFQLKDVKSIEASGTDSYKVNTTGTLELAGVKKEINLTFNLMVKGNEIILKGNYKLNMTDYNIEPPTAMFGTISTGENVTIKFETHFIK